MRYTLIVPFVAAKGRPRRAQKGEKQWLYTPERTRQAEDDIGKLWIAQHGGRLLFERLTPVRLTLQVFFRRPQKAKSRRPPLGKPDLSNTIKIVEDALNHIAYDDDAQITSVWAAKAWADADAYMVLTLEEDA